MSRLQSVRNKPVERAQGRRAVFLDRDGTVARYMEYCRRPEDLELLPGVGRAIRMLNRAGFSVVVVTNQSAVARGWLTTEELRRIHEGMHRQLKRSGARVDAVYVCPHHPDDGCGCRKPRPALLQQAARDLGLSLPRSYTVGDRLLDVQSGHAAGTTAILVRSGHPSEEDHGIAPDYEAPTLLEAVRWILQREDAAMMV
jgi:histidinol-phosphate phosphatase family protein